MSTSPVYPSSCVERFLRYVTYDTRSDETSTTTPSTPSQLVLQQVLVEELRALGLTDAVLDDNGYVYATLPATTPRADVPVVGFIAHVDTSPEVSGTDVKPIVHANYDGRDLVLPDDPARRPADERDPLPARADGARHHHGVGHDPARGRQQGGRGRDYGRRRVSRRASRDSKTARSRLRSRPTRRLAAAPATSTWHASARRAPTRWMAAVVANSSSRASRPTRSWPSSRASTVIPGSPGA